MINTRDFDESWCEISSTPNPPFQMITCRTELRPRLPEAFDSHIHGLQRNISRCECSNITTNNENTRARFLWKDGMSRLLKICVL